MGYDALIVHGSFGDPFGNWQPWLFNEITGRSKRALCPHFPGPEEQSLDSWSRVLDSYKGLIDESTVVFAHSLGPAFVLDYLATRGTRVKRLVAVAPFYGLLGKSEFDEVNRSFLLDDFDLVSAAKLCRDSVVFLSDNDPYVPEEMSRNFAKMISAPVKVIKGGGHLNSAAGYLEFPDLLEYL